MLVKLVDRDDKRWVLICENVEDGSPVEIGRSDPRMGHIGVLEIGDMLEITEEKISLNWVRPASYERQFK